MRRGASQSGLPLVLQTWPGWQGCRSLHLLKNRHGRFRDSNVFRHVFETVVSRCIEEGLVGGEGFAVDASLIPADANKQRSVSSAEHTDWHSLAASRRAVRQYLDLLDQAAWGAASEVVPKFVSRSDP